ncbi:MAG: toxic anion resistance protein [Gammaproteobacteria bacterium SHHR-1]|uniref:toxic anion resistance protein n=1 Tax=Magnetovirga frankeli TaxID=947516 RepID=UPI001293CCE2|nr:toxic anion resistance protein [gamma proteobacterium SS-5]
MQQPTQEPLQGYQNPAQAAADPARQAQLDGLLQRLLQADGPGRIELNNQLHALGSAEMAQLGTRLGLKPQGGALVAVEAGLAELLGLVDRLDPARRGPLDGRRKLFGLIPLGSLLADYFQDYVRQQGALRQAMDRLRDGRDALLRQNIDAQDQLLWLKGQEQRLRQLEGLAAGLAKRVQAALPGLEQGSGEDRQRAQWIREELLYLLQQRRSDLLSQILVAEQAQQVLKMTYRVNLDLLDGIDRALDTTLAALGVAVAAARQLTQQELVLDQLRGLQQSGLAGAEMGQLREAFSELRLGLEQLAAAAQDLEG